jgi:hypothetical protein
VTDIDFRTLAEAVERQLALFDDAAAAADRPPLALIPVEQVAWGTYGAVTGVDRAHEPVTVAGFIVFDHYVTGGLAGRYPAGQVAVSVTDCLDTDRHIPVDVVYVDPNTMVTVLPAPAGHPAGEVAPWTRMPIEQQVIEAGELAGLPVTVVPGPANPLYQIGNDPPTALSRAADYLLAGGYAHSLGHARPLLHPNRRRA